MLAAALKTSNAPEPQLIHLWKGTGHSQWSLGRFHREMQTRNKTRKNLVNPHTLWTHEGLRET